MEIVLKNVPVEGFIKKVIIGVLFVRRWDMIIWTKIAHKNVLVQVFIKEVTTYVLFVRKWDMITRSTIVYT
jgi:hypothetical protein